MPELTTFAITQGPERGAYWAELEGDGPKHGPFQFEQDARQAARKAHPEVTTIYSGTPDRFRTEAERNAPASEPLHWSHATARGDYDAW